MQPLPYEAIDAVKLTLLILLTMLCASLVPPYCRAENGPGATSAGVAEVAPPSVPQSLPVDQENRWPARLGMSLLRPVLSTLGLVHLRGWSADFQVGSEWNQQRVSEPARPAQRFSNLYVIEQLHVSNSGFVFDPRLINFSLGTTVGFTQDRIGSPGIATWNNGRRLGYNGQAMILGQKPYSLQVFASRFQDVESVELAGTTDTDVDTYGAGLFLKQLPLRSEINFSQTRTTQVSRLIPAARRNESRRRLNYRGTRLGEVSDLTVSYDFDDVDDRVFSLINFRSHRAAATYHRFFGPYLEKDLVARVDFLNRDGTSGQTRVETSETLQVDHTPTLTSVYTHGFSFTSESGTRTTVNNISAGLRHRLYKSLRTNVQAIGRYADISGGRDVIYGGTVSFNYTKRIPHEGIFSVSAGTDGRIEDEKLVGGERVVNGESHTVNDVELIFLANPRVREETIVVTDTTGTVIFQRGFDYEVTPIGDSIALERLPLGQLQDGQKILVDYSFARGRDLRFARLGTTYHTGLDYPHFSLFYDRQESNNTLLSGEGKDLLDDTTDQVVGVETRWRQAKLRATGRAEYQSYDSTSISFDSVRFNQSLTWKPLRKISMNANFRQAYSRFRNPSGRETTTLHGRLTGSWRPLRSVVLNTFSSVFWQTGKPSQDQILLDGGLRLSWRFRDLRVAPSLTVSHDRTGDLTTTTVRAALWISRRLF